jgi:hypothetical protein
MCSFAIVQEFCVWDVFLQQSEWNNLRFHGKWQSCFSTGLQYKEEKEFYFKATY